MATVPFSKVRERMMFDPEFRKEYDALGEEFAFIEAMIEALTQVDGTDGTSLVHPLLKLSGARGLESH